MRPDQLRAVICVRWTGRSSRRVAECLAHCDRCGYRMVEDRAGVPVVLSDWDVAMGMVLSGQADIIVVYDRGDPPPDRVPRWEAVTDAPADQQSPRAWRLPR